MTWQKKYRWTRTWGDETGLGGLPHEDYTGWDGEVTIGRIMLDQTTYSRKGMFMWSGGAAQHEASHSGSCPTKDGSKSTGNPPRLLRIGTIG